MTRAKKQTWWGWFRRKLCKHEFFFDDMGGPEENNGKVKVPCHKCGLVQTVDYGLQADGTFIGWRNKR